MKPTRIPLLVAIAIVAGGVAYLVTRAHYSDFPSPQPYWPVTILLLAIIELVTARTTRARLQGRPRTRPIEPIAVARTAALAKATSPVGAFFAGAYAGFLGHVSRIAGHQAATDTRTAVFGIVASVALVVAALLLEHVCKVPKPRDHD